MATLNDPNVAANIGRFGEVATGATGALHVTTRPIPTSVGHYQVNHRFVLINAQAANSRLFEIRNPSATSLIIPTQLTIQWLNSAAHTAIIEDSLDLFKVTGFTVSSTANQVLLVPSLKRTSMAATSAVVNGITVAGSSGGMTGATLTKGTSSIGQLPRIFNVAVMAGTETAPRVADWRDLVSLDEHTYPYVLAQNEGLLIENRVLLGAAAGSSVYIDFSFAEVTAY